MSEAFTDYDRLLDLLAQRALEGLDADEERELSGLLERFPDVDADMFDDVVARFDAVPLGRPGEMSGALKKRLYDDADDWMTRRKVTTLEPRRPRTESTGNVGWWAAAAAIVLGALGWFQALQVPSDSASTVATTPPVEEALSPERARERLVAQGDSLSLPWSTTDDPAAGGVTGDVVWDQANQEGYMRFVGLPANDPSVSQYQLWIFDGERDDRYPVDGGVFDVSDSGETVVAIDPRLRIESPALFAITIERPGGVVVSSRERLVVLAQVNPG